MPVLVDAIPEDLDKLLQDCSLTPIASLRKSSGVVEVAVHAAFVFIVRILCSKDCRTHGTREVFDVVLLVQRSDVRPAQRSAAIVT